VRSASPATPTSRSGHHGLSAASRWSPACWPRWGASGGSMRRAFGRRIARPTGRGAGREDPATRRGMTPRCACWTPACATCRTARPPDAAHVHDHLGPRAWTCESPRPTEPAAAWQAADGGQVWLHRSRPWPPTTCRGYRRGARGPGHGPCPGLGVARHSPLGQVWSTWRWPASPCAARRPWCRRRWRAGGRAGDEPVVRPHAGHAHRLRRRPGGDFSRTGGVRG
jgi:hypothetical protein